MTHGMDLVYRGRTVELRSRRFTAFNWPRTRIETPEINRNAFGTPSERGFSFEPPHIWTVGIVLRDRDSLTVEATTFSDAEKLDALYSVWQIHGGDIILHDYTRYFFEEAPRTRALAAGAAELVDDGVVRYFAQFNVRFQDALTKTIQTDFDVAFDFTLVETTKVVA